MNEPKKLEAAEDLMLEAHTSAYELDAGGENLIEVGNEHLLV